MRGQKNPTTNNVERCRNNPLKSGTFRSPKTINQLTQKAHEIELKNMLTTANLIIKAALLRKKSLGCHYIKN